MFVPSCFSGMTNREVAEKVPYGYRMGKPRKHYCADFIYEIMCKCWHEDPSCRPSFDSMYDQLTDFDETAGLIYAESSVALK